MRSRTMKVGICSKCHEKYPTMQIRKDMICGDCNIKYNVVEYRKKMNVEYDPPRY